MRSGAHASLSLPLSAVIDLHEIHLARQSSLQVPVGRIPVPGGIKLCSPGTFIVAIYLIINNGSFQVNFTKINRATILYTNSQWLREDATEAAVGKVAVKNPVVNPTLTRQQYRFPSLRHATVPQKYLWAGWSCRRRVRSPFRHAVMPLEYLWAGLPCRRPVRSPLRHAGMPLRYLWAGWPCQRPVRSPPFATPGWLWSTCGQGGRAEDRSEAPFATPGWLWSTCGQGGRAEDRPERQKEAGLGTLCHARLALEHLWAGSTCQSRL